MHRARAERPVGAGIGERGKAGAADEYTGKRSSGASFNPKPARVCDVLIREARIAKLDVLLAALILSTPAGQRNLISAEAAELVREAEDFVLRDSISSEELSLQLAASIAIDALRHLHLQAEPETQASRLFQDRGRAAHMTTVDRFDRLFFGRPKKSRRQAGCAFRVRTC